jgi:hypothetical protein
VLSRCVPATQANARPNTSETTCGAGSLITFPSMRDGDIRPILRDRLAAVHQGDEGVLLLEELGLCRGTARADLAVVNGMLKGYEIKSDRDTLFRLPSQAPIYSQVFDTVTLVVAERHLTEAMAITPDWWGIEVALSDQLSKVTLVTVRVEGLNACVDPHSLVQLLWRDEVLSILERLSPEKSFSRKPRKVLWNYLTEALPLPALKAAVRDSLKGRTRWLFDAPQRSGDGMFPRFSMWSGCRALCARKRNRQYTHRPN